MTDLDVSKSLVDLVLKNNSSIEYFINETLGYISDERGRNLPCNFSINGGQTIRIELPDELCDEIRANFCDDFSLSQAVNIVLLCGYVFGGI